MPVISNHLVNIVGTSLEFGTYTEISGLAETDVVVITKSSVADLLGLAYDGWSPWDNDAHPGAVVAGKTWTNRFKVRNAANVDVYTYSDAFYVDAAGALAALQAVCPLAMTGQTAYRFYFPDVPASDNRGGLSLHVAVYALEADILERLGPALAAPERMKHAPPRTSLDQPPTNYYRQLEQFNQEAREKIERLLTIVSAL
jgi:hypothetical protein